MNIHTKPLHIVLTDDDPDESILFRDALDNIDISYQFTAAEDGTKLINLLNTPLFSPDIIFLDLNMPGKSGRDCLLEIRKDKKYDTIPIIMYSTSSHPKDVEDCYMAKANMYAVKSSSFRSLVNLLDTIFNVPTDSLLKPLKEKFIVIPATG